MRWDLSEEDTLHGVLEHIRSAFLSDWREGLFLLAAEKTSPENSLTFRYWRGLAERFLTGLCHIPGSSAEFQVETPSDADYATLVLTAPPMPGGEYLSSEVLSGIWSALDTWAHEAVSASGGLDAFFQSRAPQWRQVGRVCFHLAENKNDIERPFAFMATYSSGFGAAGQLKHLPLGKALEQYAGAKNKSALIKLLYEVIR